MMAASVPVPCPPAPAVVVFQRSEDDLTRVTLASHAQPAASIDPRVFSNFLEHLGGSVYEALWANVIYNPQFEAERDGMLARWSLNGAQWLEGGVRGRYVRCTEGTAVVQRLTLPTHRVLRYRGTIWVRSLGSKHPVLTVSLRKDDSHVVVEGINLVKKHVKPNPMKGTTGGIVEKAMPIHQSNVAIYNAATGKADRVGIKLQADGTRVRVFKSSGAEIKA